MKLNYKNSCGNFYNFIRDLEHTKYLDKYLTELLTFMKNKTRHTSLLFVPLTVDYNNQSVVANGIISNNAYDILSDIKALPEYLRTFDKDTMSIKIDGYEMTMSIRLKNK